MLVYLGNVLDLVHSLGRMNREADRIFLRLAGASDISRPRYAFVPGKLDSTMHLEMK